MHSWQSGVYLWWESKELKTVFLLSVVYWSAQTPDGKEPLGYSAHSLLPLFSHHLQHLCFQLRGWEIQPASPARVSTYLCYYYISLSIYIFIFMTWKGLFRIFALQIHFSCSRDASRQTFLAQVISLISLARHFHSCLSSEPHVALDVPEFSKPLLFNGKVPGLQLWPSTDFWVSYRAVDIWGWPWGRNKLKLVPQDGWSYVCTAEQVIFQEKRLEDIMHLSQLTVKKL